MTLRADNFTAHSKTLRGSRNVLKIRQVLECSGTTPLWRVASHQDVPRSVWAAALHDFFQN